MYESTENPRYLAKIQLLPWAEQLDVDSLLRSMREYEVTKRVIRPYNRIYINQTKYYVVLFCDPEEGGILTEHTQVYTNGKPIVPLKKVHFLALPPFNASTSPLAQRVTTIRLNRGIQEEGNTAQETCDISIDDINTLCDRDTLCKLYVEPYFKKYRKEPVYVGRRINMEGIVFLVWACDPCQIGVINKNTAVYIDWDCFGEFKRIHVMPFSDTLPQTYSYDIFQDYLKPFLSRYTFHPFCQGESFTYNGVQFKVVATDPVGVKARIGDNTTIFCQGSLTPSIVDLLPIHLLENITRLPPRSRPFAILQALTHLPPSDVDRIFGMADANNNRGVNNDVISTISQKAFTYHSQLQVGSNNEPSDEPPMCTVCLSEVNNGENVVKLNCQHLFHLQCIQEWLRMSVICPLCKVDVRS
ncbi:zinc finger, C3HC4 type domain-containing protein [Cryptosporidium serpentis]